MTKRNQVDYQKLNEDPNQYHPPNLNYRAVGNDGVRGPAYQTQGIILNAQPVFNHQLPIYPIAPMVQDPDGDYRGNRLKITAMGAVLLVQFLFTIMIGFPLRLNLTPFYVFLLFMTGAEFVFLFLLFLLCLIKKSLSTLSLKIAKVYIFISIVVFIGFFLYKQINALINGYVQEGFSFPAYFGLQVFYSVPRAVSLWYATKKNNYAIRAY